MLIERIEMNEAMEMRFFIGFSLRFRSCYHKCRLARRSQKEIEIIAAYQAAGKTREYQAILPPRAVGRLGRSFPYPCGLRRKERGAGEIVAMVTTPPIAGV